MSEKRTDLAMEAHEIWDESAAETTALKGVYAEDGESEGFPVNTVKILSDEGSQSLGKPRGTYITITMDGFLHHEENAFERLARVVSTELEKLLPINENSRVLVVGLGNSAVTPDSIGPRCAENIMVTRHLVSNIPEYFSDFRPVSVIAPGVLGTTGIESSDVIRGVASRTSPDAIIAIDALVSRRLHRVCSTIQLADTGIIPGSGVGNAREALNQSTLGIPVIAIGIPTVVDAATLAADIAEEAGIEGVSAESLQGMSGGVIVTPREIDVRITDISKVVGYGINMALHRELSIDDITMFLS